MSINRFQVTEELPEVGVSQENYYQVMRTLQPTAELVDGVGLQVAGGVVLPTNAMPYWRKYSVPYTQLVAAALTADMELFVLPAGGVVHGVKVKASAAFTGTGIATLTVSVGIAGTLAKYSAAFDVMAAPSDTNLLLTLASGTPTPETHASSGKSIRIAATATGANLDQMTAGSVDVWVLWSAAA